MSTNFYSVTPISTRQRQELNDHITASLPSADTPYSDDLRHRYTRIAETILSSLPPRPPRQTLSRMAVPLGLPPRTILQAQPRLHQGIPARQNHHRRIRPHLHPRPVPPGDRLLPVPQPTTTRRHRHIPPSHLLHIPRQPALLLLRRLQLTPPTQWTHNKSYSNSANYANPQDNAHSKSEASSASTSTTFRQA